MFKSADLGAVSALGTRIAGFSKLDKGLPVASRAPVHWPYPAILHKSGSTGSHDCLGVRVCRIVRFRGVPAEKALDPNIENQRLLKTRGTWKHRIGFNELRADALQPGIHEALQVRQLLADPSQELLFVLYQRRIAHVLSDEVDNKSQCACRERNDGGR